MMRRLLAILMPLLLASVALAQDGVAPRELAAEKRVNHLSQRLAGLSPDRPRAYFELGEEVASEASDDLDRRLARQLFALAFELSRRSAQPDTQLPSSVCLALAAIADTDEERRWLAALAETLAPPGSAPPDPVRIKSSAASRDPAAFDLASMLGLVRIGEGRRAERLLARPGVERLLDKCDPLLMPAAGGGAAMVRKQIEEWPSCPQCHNKRFVRDSSGIHLCPTCHGAPGPTLSPMELLGHIRTESILLSGQQRSWAAQIISDYGAPVRELDASELASTYAADPMRPLWRNGHWETDPNAAKPTAAGAPASTPDASAGEGPAAAPVPQSAPAAPAAPRKSATP
jgi:hypothetical protein